MSDKNEKDIKGLLEEQVTYQRRIAKDLHSIYVLIILGIVCSFFAAYVILK